MASKKKLATVVYVDGVAYGPGDVPAAVETQIDNPKVWASDDDASAADESGSDSGDDA